MIRALAAALLLLAAAPASSGELIRFRAADGSIGLVDHPSKLPPGAVVLKLSERTRSTGPAPEPVSRPAQLPAARRERYRGSSSAGSSSSARDGWCSRGRSAEQRLERAEERLAAAEDAYDRCDDGGRVNYCSHSRVESAEREIENARQAQNDLEADCRRSACEPGWIRCAP